MVLTEHFKISALKWETVSYDYIGWGTTVENVITKKQQKCAQNDAFPLECT